MTADFVLYLRDVLDDSRVPDWRSRYWPETLVYLPELSGPMELFARAQSAHFFDDMKTILNISSKDELKPVFEAMQQGKIHVPRWDWHSIDPAAIAGFANLATKP